MVKIRVIYDDQREVGEVIKLLSSRLNYCRIESEGELKRAFLGIETSDLLTLPGEPNIPEENKNIEGELDND